MEESLKGNIWGLMGSELLPHARRSRTLGLGASVRRFNDLAVPGIGGVWYGKQLLLATLGVAVAEEARNRGTNVQNIEVTNAIEALACWLAFNNNGWQSDVRLHGRTKLQDKRQEDFHFKQARQRSFYVTQPMRMATVQALPALGFVEAEGIRFNSFRCIRQIDATQVKNEKAEETFAFLENALKDLRPSVIDHLVGWVMGENKLNFKALGQALSPLIALPDSALALLRERLIQGGKEEREDRERRNQALAWVEVLREKRVDSSWKQKPSEISEAHWDDLHAGALFFKTREAAIAVLDALEENMGNQATQPSYSLGQKIPVSVMDKLAFLKSAAEEYSGKQHQDQDAKDFCKECRADDPCVLRSLVNRDGLVLRLEDDSIKPGPAFRGSTVIEANDEEGQEATLKESLPLPPYISYRIRNLYLLNLDLRGELETWLTNSREGET